MSTSKVQLFKEVAIIPDVKTVWDFYTLAMQNKIAVLPEWLQRLQQKKKWRKNKGEKTLSFLQSFFVGNHLLTPFYMVSINVLIDYIENENKLETDKTIKDIHSDMLFTLNNKKSQGVEFILLDGQNRLEEAIKPFFQGTLLSNIYKKPFIFLKEEKSIELNNFKFTDLDLSDDIKETFKNVQIIVAEGKDGHIESYVNSIIDMNNGEPWSLFECTIIKPTALAYLINKDIFHDPIIQSLFGNDELSGNVKGMSGSYEIEKKGDAKFICELVYLIGNNCDSGIGTENDNANIIINSEQKFVTAYKKVKSYLNFISVNTDCVLNKNLKEKQKIFDKESLRGLILFLDLIINKSNTEYDNCLLNIKELQNIHISKPIFEDFIKWHNEKVDIETTPQDFIEGEPKPGTYVFNTRGASNKNMKSRLGFINSFITDNYNEWVSKHYISSEYTDYRKYETYLKKKNNYKDPYSKADTKINLRSLINTDHILSKRGKKEGTNSVDNLVITNPKSNKIKSNRV